MIGGGCGYQREGEKMGKKKRKRKVKVPKDMNIDFMDLYKKVRKPTPKKGGELEQPKKGPGSYNRKKEKNKVRKIMDKYI